MVTEVFQADRSERIKLSPDAGSIAGDKCEQFGADMKMAQNKKIRLRADEIFQAQVDQLMQNPR
jgi:hypothetical protein